MRGQYYLATTQNVLVTELTRSPQCNISMAVSVRALLFSRFADYSYSLDKADIHHYSLEQQASLVSDY